MGRGASLIPATFNKVGFDDKLRRFAAGLPLTADDAHFSWRTIFDEDEKKSLLHPDVYAATGGELGLDEFRRHFEAVDGCHYLDRECMSISRHGFRPYSSQGRPRFNGALAGGARAVGPPSRGVCRRASGASQGEGPRDKIPPAPQSLAPEPSPEHYRRPQAGFQTPMAPAAWRSQGYDEGCDLRVRAEKIRADGRCRSLVAAARNAPRRTTATSCSVCCHWASGSNYRSYRRNDSRVSSDRQWGERPPAMGLVGRRAVPCRVCVVDGG